jgi:type IV pilus assembly protein PilC
MVQTFRKKLFVSLVYPALLVSVVTVMLIFLITYVVPKFADLFNNLGAQAAGDHGVHAVGGAERAEVCLALCAGGGGGFVLWRWKQSDRGGGTH